jgi:hypothetical protein
LGRDELLDLPKSSIGVTVILMEMERHAEAIPLLEEQVRVFSMKDPVDHDMLEPAKARLAKAREKVAAEVAIE